MKLSELKQHLQSMTQLVFELPDGTKVPAHFHVTEVGQVSKHYIDCGGTERQEKKVSFQLWEAGDFDHRLAPQKLQSIIALSEKVLHLEDAEIEVEYQGKQTISRYGLELGENNLLLTSLQTACLASDSCGIPPEKKKIRLSDLTVTANSCSPEGGCCS